jgi:hypothetical protein
MGFLRGRLALYSQLLIAAGCMASFERYIQTGRHPLGWEESAVRLAYSLRWVLFLWVAIEVAIARFQHWRCIFCVMSSFVLTVIIDGVFWGAIVRY